MLRAFEVAVEVEASFAEACRETGGDWPAGYCVEASVALRDELREKVPDAGAEYVWGRFGDPLREEHRVGHAWVELAGGTILDVTVRQFGEWIAAAFGPDAVAMITMPGEQLADAYHEQERGTPDERPAA